MFMVIQYLLYVNARSVRIYMQGHVKVITNKGCYYLYDLHIYSREFVMTLTNFQNLDEFTGVLDDNQKYKGVYDELDKVW